MLNTRTITFDNIIENHTSSKYLNQKFKDIHKTTVCKAEGNIVMNDYANDEIKTSLVNTGLLEEVLCNQAEMAKILVDIKANL